MVKPDLLAECREDIDDAVGADDDCRGVTVRFGSDHGVVGEPFNYSSRTNSRP
jgi:hypothetical protein